MTHDEAIATLKVYVIHEYDGSIGANFKLDELLWAVRLSHPHNHPSHRMVQTESAVPDNLDDLEIDLTELGL